jgi:hypothetical protein
LRQEVVTSEPYFRQMSLISTISTEGIRQLYVELRIGELTGITKRNDTSYRASNVRTAASGDIQFRDTSDPQTADSSGSARLDPCDGDEVWILRRTLLLSGGGSRTW